MDHYLYFDPSGIYGAGSMRPMLDGLLSVLSAIYFLCAMLLLVFGCHVYFLILMRYRMSRRKNRSNDRGFDDLPHVTVQVPVFNEGPIAVESLRLMATLDYPSDKLQIIMIDGSTDGTPELLAPVVADLKQRGCNVMHYRRDNSRGYKAGGLQEAIQLSTGDFIALFDADFRPPRDFLLRTVHRFADSGVGCVQARAGHANADANAITACQTMTLDAFYGTELPVRSNYNLFVFFAGTCGIWRKQCIIDSGGWTSDTLAEDMDLSYRAQLRGWRFIYEQDVVSRGELPDSLPALMRQQYRWTMGHTQVFRKMLRPVLSSGLGFGKKIETLIHLSRWINYPALLLMALLMAPTLVISPQVRLAGMTEYAFGLLIFCLATGAAGIFCISGQMILNPGRWYRKIWTIPIILGLSVAQAPYNVRGILMALIGRHEKFHKTPRSGERISRLRGAESWLPWVNLLFGLYLTTGAGVAFYTAWRIDYWSLLIPAFTLTVFGGGALFGSYAGWRQLCISARPAASAEVATVSAG